jgi:hypothetical protein
MWFSRFFLKILRDRVIGEKPRLARCHRDHGHVKQYLNTLLMCIYFTFTSLMVPPGTFQEAAIRVEQLAASCAATHLHFAIGLLLRTRAPRPGDFEKEDRSEGIYE